MAAKSYYLDDALLDAVLRNTAYVSPAAVFVGLFTVAPANPGDAGTEVTTVATAYVRQAATFAAPGGDGVTETTADVTFPVATLAYGAPVVAVGIWDLVAGGNLLYYGTLGTPKTVGLGDQVAFATGALTIQEQ